MKIPARIRITSRDTYEIVYIKAFKDEDQLGECRGETDEEPKQIVLLESLKPTIRAKIFIHELIHAICFEYGVKIPHSVIHELEEPIYSILKLNKFI